MSPPTPGRTRLTGMVLLIAVFAAGMLAGTAFDRLLTAGEVGPAEAAACERGGRGPHMIIDEVDLEPAQRARVQEILDRRRALTDSLWRADGQRIRAAVDSTREEIRAILTPEQRADYDRRREEHERRRRERGEAAKGGAGS
jgi:Spy/CpxP family protein refolding chaperone